ncbi:MAG: CRISPR-associated endonuclease Cas2 [Propionibacteriaceae bacterium]|jgi:CRISPR-associated protein Cas2|nr:CRISPR-associated endonuclease Cas2 [Propionibacteriaceae bacterium]
MFDLPVKTKQQRRSASEFRHLLLDVGYQMAQLSVYVRFSPSVASILPCIRTIKRNLPEGGEVRIVAVTDRQWATALRYSNGYQEIPEEEPMQLTIF